jgi:RimJ/RimL family protein N-acetyltransferase
VCAAILDYGFTQLGFESVGADAAISNVKSVKILESFGFLAVAETEEQRYYILNKKDWRNRR